MCFSLLLFLPSTAVPTSVGEKHVISYFNLSIAIGSRVIIHSDNPVPWDKGKRAVPPVPQPNPYAKPFPLKCLKC